MPTKHRTRCRIALSQIALEALASIKGIEGAQRRLAHPPASRSTSTSRRWCRTGSQRWLLRREPVSRTGASRTPLTWSIASHVFGTSWSIRPSPIVAHLRPSTARRVWKWLGPGLELLELSVLAVIGYRGKYRCGRSEIGKAWTKSSYLGKNLRPWDSTSSASTRAGTAIAANTLVGQLPRRAREPVEVGEPRDPLEGRGRRGARRAADGDPRRHVRPQRPDASAGQGDDVPRARGAVSRSARHPEAAGARRRTTPGR